MPRAFDSDQQTEGPLVFTEIMVCPACGAEQVVTFTDDSMTVEDMAEPPSTQHTCEIESCGHIWAATAEGWFNYGDA